MSYDVVVVGAGNAALCAAIAARETGASVLVCERAPYERRGGNTGFTAGAMRVVYRGLDDLLELVPDLSASEIETTEFGTYTKDQFLDDMARVTDFRSDPDLVEVLVTHSFETLRWMRQRGVRFAPIYGRQAFEVDGCFKFWGGLTLEAVGGGPGLLDALTVYAEKCGVHILYGTRVMDLLSQSSHVVGVRARNAAEETIDIKAGAVVLGCGGFQANTEWRTRYLGPGWDLAKVRGTQFNTGDGIRMGLGAGAISWGNWSGCHAVAWELNAPHFGDPKVGDQFQKHSYPFGVMINARGERFVDEGADFRNYTYAKYGREILNQPGQFAWQVFDAKVSHLLRDEYRIRQTTKVQADTLEDLAQKMEEASGVSTVRFLRNLEKYNASIDTRTPFDPNILDGRCTENLSVPKSNWANAITEPPFEAYAVTCGITFTFGGLRITPQGQVVDTEGSPITGLYACGELVGGLFYFNYPGGAGLTSGAVFGRISGTNAATLSISGAGQGGAPNVAGAPSGDGVSATREQVQ